MTDEKETLARKLREFRKEQKLNQFEFAEDCGISKDTLSLIECGKENVTIDTLQLLSARMDKSISELLTPGDVKYILVPSTLTTYGLTETIYGIAAIDRDIMVDYIPNISKDYNKVLSAVRLFNEEELFLCHFREVIESEFN